jgi:hypothetical protein
MITESAIGPEAFAGEEVGVDLLADLTGLWAPTIRLSALHAQSPTSHSPFGDAEFRFMALRLRFCPTRWPTRTPFGARVCVNGDWGELRARGLNTYNHQTHRVVWWAAGPSLRLDWMPWRWAGIELEGGLVLPSRHDRFVFQPGAYQVHRVPDVGTNVGLGAVVRIP